MKKKTTAIYLSFMIEKGPKLKVAKRGIKDEDWVFVRFFFIKHTIISRLAIPYQIKV